MLGDPHDSIVTRTWYNGIELRKPLIPTVALVVLVFDERRGFRTSTNCPLSGEPIVKCIHFREGEKGDELEAKAGRNDAEG